MQICAALVVALTALVVPDRAPEPADLPRLESEKNVGLADLEEDRLAQAKKRFDAVRKLAPEEPLGWTDGAIAAMRGKELPEAARLLAQALRLAPSSGRVWAVEGERRELAGETAAAVEAYGRAVAADPRDLPARWSLAKLSLERGAVERPNALREVRSALEQAPSNVFLLLRLLEAEREGPDRAAALATANRLKAALEAETRADVKIEKYLAEGIAAMGQGDGRAASVRFRLVENLLRNLPRYQQARHDVEPGVVGMPIEDWSPALAARIRARGRAVPVRFVEQTPAPLGSVRGVAAVRAFGRDGRDLALAGDAGLRIAASRDGYRPGTPLPGSAGRTVAVADVNNSGELDLVVPGALWSAAKGSFRRTAIAGGERVVPLDYDNDGDLDLYVSSRSGDRLLRNNLDGTWTDVTAAALPGRVESRAAAAADFDRDGDMDLALVRASGGILLLDNLRGGRFAEREAGLPKSGAFVGIAAGDLNADGRPDLVFTTETSVFVALNRGDGTFLPAVEMPAGGTPLLFDFDNDGSLDLLLVSPRGTSLFRNDGAGRFARVDAAIPAAVDAAAVDIDGDGDLDLVLVTPAGGVSVWKNEGGNANAWLDVALEGLPTGSAKVNRFGYGSEVEVKSGELYVFRTVSSPVTHVGLGASRRADVLRIVWTNGVPQNALSPATRTLVREVQQLKGSCPFLYAFDGRRWSFVTDVLGASPMGLLYDGVHQAAANTREWLIVPGALLAPSAGRLRVDFTEELWETVYLDLARLSAVDHPAGTEVVTNERMIPPPFPEKRLFTISQPRVSRASDGRGRDRTAEIAREDGRYLSGFAPTRYQGIVEPHELVLELPRAAAARRVMLYLTGWIFYSDTSIQVSLSQGTAVRVVAPQLDVPDGRGGWRVALPAIGYPIGKTKTIAIDLSDVLDRRDPRVRIRTNLAIFWDRIAYTADDPDVPVRVTRAPLATARLFFRGFSRMTRQTPDGPQVFLHDDVDRSPRWADMAGWYTRLGDVRDLLALPDDRYVVMKGGDAVRLEFDASALPALPDGWVRDWLFESDGWEKDADKNTVAGQTVEPLPFHGMDDSRYGEAQTMPDEEAHRRFREEYLTRRGGPEEFVDAVRTGGTRDAGLGTR
jgi:tetratricopeptide (TPR) repeat protein